MAGVRVGTGTNEVNRRRINHTYHDEDFGF